MVALFIFYDQKCFYSFQFCDIVNVLTRFLNKTFLIGFQVLSQLHEIFFGFSCWGFDFLIAICSDFDSENSSNM